MLENSWKKKRLSAVLSFLEIDKRNMNSSFFCCYCENVAGKKMGEKGGTTLKGKNKKLVR